MRNIQFYINKLFLVIIFLLLINFFFFFQITKLRVEHCGKYTNCSSCLESRDPFCGWCSLEKRCTVRSACQKDTSASRWLSLGTGQQCIDFEMVLPDKIPINQMGIVSFFIFLVQTSVDF